MTLDERDAQTQFGTAALKAEYEAREQQLQAFLTSPGGIPVPMYAGLLTVVAGAAHTYIQALERENARLRQACDDMPM